MNSGIAIIIEEVRRAARHHVLKRRLDAAHELLAVLPRAGLERHPVLWMVLDRQGIGGIGIVCACPFNRSKGTVRTRATASGVDHIAPVPVVVLYRILLGIKCASPASGGVIAHFSNLAMIAP